MTTKYPKWAVKQADTRVTPAECGTSSVTYCDAMSPCCWFPPWRWSHKCDRFHTESWWVFLFSQLCLSGLKLKFTASQSIGKNVNKIITKRKLFFSTPKMELHIYFVLFLGLNKNTQLQFVAKTAQPSDFPWNKMVGQGCQEAEQTSGWGWGQPCGRGAATPQRASNSDTNLLKKWSKDHKIKGCAF